MATKHRANIKWSKTYLSIKAQQVFQSKLSVIKLAKYKIFNLLCNPLKKQEFLKMVSSSLSNSMALIPKNL